MFYGKDLVLALFPEAEARPGSDGGGGFLIATHDGPGVGVLGRGPSEADAWSDAALRLATDDWFRPIIQILAAEARGPGHLATPRDC